MEVAKDRFFALFCQKIWRRALGCIIFAVGINFLYHMENRSEEKKYIFEAPDAEPKYWIGVQVNHIPTTLLKELTQNSFEIVKAKYSKKRKSSSQK